MAEPELRLSKRWSAAGLIDLVIDDGSFEPWDQPVDISDHSESYQAELRKAEKVEQKARHASAIAEAKDPVLMARAMKSAVEAGRMAYLAGRMGRRMYADPSSPLAGLI